MSLRIFSTVGRWAGLALALMLLAGCATSNYDFTALPEPHGSSRAKQLTADLMRQQQAGGEDDLYELDLIPLLRLRLKVFAAEDDPGFAGGYVEANLESHLPLFGFLDATVDRYDEASDLHDRHELKAYFWGLFQAHRESRVTGDGLRRKRYYRVLWIFGWSGRPGYAARVI